MITTTQNKQIKQIIKLKKSARERRKQELFLVEGIRMFTEIPEGIFIIKSMHLKIFITNIE